MSFAIFVIISPWKRAGPFIWTKLKPLHPRMLCAKFGRNWHFVLEKKMKMWKVYRRTDGRTDRQTDDGRQVIKKAHLSFQLRWAKKGAGPFIKSDLKGLEVKIIYLLNHKYFVIKYSTRNVDHNNVYLHIIHLGS